jgi:RNA polymerase sigma factor (sigma-70 family)
MQPTQISSETHQDEQIELIEIVRLRNQPHATWLDIRKSDRAFAKLFGFYEKCLYKLTNKIFGHDAEEYFHIALDGFLKAVESFKFIGTFSGWVTYKVKKALLDQARKPQRSVKGKAEKDLTFMDHLDLEAIAPHQESAADQISESCEEDLTEFNAAIGQLTDYEREIIRLHNEEYSWPEIGQIVGKNPDAARMEMYRAILSVRTALGIETKVKHKKKAVPVIGWMRRLWDRFQKSVRVEVSSDDIRSEVILPQKKASSTSIWPLDQFLKSYQPSVVREHCSIPSVLAVCRRHTLFDSPLPRLSSSKNWRFSDA